MLIEAPVAIPTPDGAANGFVYRPADGRTVPGVIYLTDIGGIRESTRGMAARLASEGYAVLLPNVFYRTGQPPVIEYPIRSRDERTMTRLAELRDPLTPEAIDRDASAYVDVLRQLPFVASGPMAAVGFCFTGAVALRAAATRPDAIAAAASFHGGGLFTDAPTSPHLVLPRTHARLYFAHAIEDRTMPAEAIARLEGALSTWGGQFESETYDGAHHAWTVPDSPVYNVPQAERAFAKLLTLLRETLSSADAGIQRA